MVIRRTPAPSTSRRIWTAQYLKGNVIARNWLLYASQNLPPTRWIKSTIGGTGKAFSTIWSVGKSIERTLTRWFRLPVWRVFQKQSSSFLRYIVN
jgi:hypothetical protein